MRKFIVLSMVTLDGVIQAPGGPDEDTSNGFRYGGWAAPFNDEVYSKAVQEELQPTDYLLGRKTFDIWENYWPQHGDFWPGINEGVKYVLSKSRKNSNWDKSQFIPDVEGIKKLKATDGRDIQIWGSSELVHLLLQNDLVDELRLKIHPILLGKGKKLFDADSIPSNFTLVESKSTPTGVILAHYKRNGEVKTGSMQV